MLLTPVLVAACLFALTAVLAGPVPPLLARAAWPERSPRAALVLWQAIIGAVGLSLVTASLALAVAPLAATFRHGVHVFVLQAVAGQPLRGLGTGQVIALAWAIVVVGGPLGLVARTAARNIRTRRRHRGRVDLLAERSETYRGVHVIDHPSAAAYCLPGRRARVVITSGLVGLLNDRELAAVLDHERAHARGRHHLVLLPFVALAQALPRLPAAQLADRCVRRLVEMLADDHARSRHGGTVVARALLRLVTHRSDPAHAPGGALGAAEHAVVARIHRLTSPARPPAAWIRLLVYAGSTVLVAAPVALLLPCVTW